MGKGIQVEIQSDGKKVTLETVKGRNLRELFSVAKIAPDMPCAGRGRCGKCRVTFAGGAPDPNSADLTFLTEKEIEGGVRLACRCVLDKDCEIHISNEQIEAVTTETAPEPLEVTDSDSFGIAIDLGTTTIAAAIVRAGQENGKVLKTSAVTNSQRRFGADVISRIAACEDEKTASQMRESVLLDISQLIKQLLLDLTDSGKISISGICIAGNTTMLHILRGYDTSGLGKYPYRPVSTSFEEISAKELFGSEVPEGLDECSVFIIPGISAFVGADIVSGLYYIDNSIHNDEDYLFLDLGTNGEMAYASSKGIKVTSTAAGPVFEGGSISCGCSSVPGAIAHLGIDSEKKQVNNIETIGDKPPVGLCGSGVIETVAELVSSGIVDETGLLSDEYFEEGFPVTPDKKVFFTQQDIRNVQLAKAAVYTGVQSLLGENTPKQVFISGGFGSSLDMKKIKELGMLPGELSDKATALGNTSLEGCIDFLSRALTDKKEADKEKEKLEKIAAGATEVILANMDEFSETYIETLNFR